MLCIDIVGWVTGRESVMCHLYTKFSFFQNNWRKRTEGQLSDPISPGQWSCRRL